MMIHGVMRTSSSVCQVTLRWSRTSGGGHVSTSPLQVQSASGFNGFRAFKRSSGGFQCSISQSALSVRRLAVLDIANCELTTIHSTPAGSAVNHYQQRSRSCQTMPEPMRLQRI